MSTTKQLVVHKGLNNIIRSRATGYWDNKSVFSYTSENENKNVLMDVYDGLSGSFEVGISSSSKMDFSDTVLPWKWDYSDELKEKRFCLMSVGNGDRYQNISELGYSYNFTVVGSPNINNKTKVVSGFSTSNLLRLTNMPTYSAGTIDSFEYMFKVHTPTSWTSNGRIINDKNSYDNMKIEMNTSSITLNYSSSGYISASGTYTSNIDYWIKITYDGTDMNLYYSTDGEEYTLGATSAVDKSNITISSTTFDIGCRSYDNYAGCVWNGSIDLSESYIKINDEYYWNPTFTEVPKINYNFTKVGTPTINDFIVSGFSSSNYVKLDNSIPLSTANSVEIVIKVNIDDLSNINCIIGNLTDNYNSGGFVLRTQGGARLYLWSTSQKTSWNVGNYNTGIDLQIGINYIKLLWNGTSYDFYISTDNINWTQGNTLTTNPISDFIIVLGDSVSMYLHGSMDLSESYIKINNEMWWQGAEYAVESLKGCLYNYNDTGVSSTLNAFVVNGDESIVLTPDSTYGDNRYLGTVTIPSHDIYSYNNGVWTKL